MKRDISPGWKSFLRANWIRFLGVVLLAVLLTRLDVGQVYATLVGADSAWIFVAAAFVMPLIALKAVRWQVMLGAQAIYYRFWPAYLAYFASMFIGFLTPGRVGEFSKAIYVSRECKVSSGRAFSGVLADRLFDLYTVFVVSMFALANLYGRTAEWIVLVSVGALSIIPLVLFLSERTFAWLQRVGSRLGRVGGVFAADGWLNDMRLGLLALKWPSVIVAFMLTVVAYGLYFAQCYLLALALGMRVGVLQVAYAVALGGLVALLPISIAGLGTREAVISLYLGNWGVTIDTAVSFSLLIFAVFYLIIGLIGAFAWWLKPLPLFVDPQVKE